MKKTEVYIVIVLFFMVSCNSSHKNRNNNLYKEFNNESFESKDASEQSNSGIIVSKGISLKNRGFVLLNDVKLLEKESYSRLKQIDVTEFLRLTTRMIDSNADGYFEQKTIENKVKKFFPNKNDEGFCVINWEREAFQKLKNNNQVEFDLATNQYIELIQFIKKLRPEVKVGIYGMPFRQNTIKNPNRFYSNTTTENILSEVDFLAPSLYLLYSEEEVGMSQMQNYLKTNIERAFELANGKPVIPYIGYRIYSKHSKDSWKLIPQSTFRKYVGYLLNSKGQNNQQISGFIMWNGDFVDYRDRRKTYTKHDIPQQKFTNEYNSTALFYFSLIDELLNK